MHAIRRKIFDELRYSMVAVRVDLDHRKNCATVSNVTGCSDISFVNDDTTV